MAHVSDPELVVLNGLRLKGLATGPALADATGLDPRTADELLGALATRELVTRRQGRISGWVLTAAGRDEHGLRLTEEMERCDCRDQLESAYKEFLVLNPDLLHTCTAWQMREGPGGATPNDHSDSEYDAMVVGRLTDIDDAIQPTCMQLSGLMERMGTYGRRLATARRRVEAGDVDWFTRPLFDSYHSVWFELHEDFLMTLGRERGSDPSAVGSQSSLPAPGGGETRQRRVS